MILHTNKWCVLISDQNLPIFFKSIWKIPSASGHSHSPFTSCRTRPSWHNGCIRLSVSTVNRTYELSGITHVTPFRKYGKHSTGPSTYGPWARTYSKLFSCKPVLTVCSYGAQSNEICTYGRVSRGTIPRVRRYGLLYLRTVEYDQWILTGPARVEWLWVNDFSHNKYHIWQAWPSTCWHVGNKLPKYEVPVFIAQTRNHWRKWKGCASVPKNGLPNWCD